MAALFAGHAAGASGCRPVERAAVAPGRPSVDLNTLALAARLPTADTLAVLVAPRPSRLFEVAGEFSRVDGLAARREMLALDLLADMGRDLTRVRPWLAAGVDPNAPALLALVGWPRETWVVGLTLRDPDAFRAALYEHIKDFGSIGGRPQVTQGRLVLADDGLAVLIEGSSAFVVSGRRAATQMQRMLALRPEVSLSQRADFQRAVGGMSGELWGYAPPRSAIYPMAEMDPRWAGANLADTVEHLELMRRRVLAAAAGSERDIESMRRSDADYRSALESLRDDRLAQLLRRYFGTLQGMGMSLQVREDHARAALWLPLNDDHPLAKLLVGTDKPAALAAAPDAQLQLAAHLQPTLASEALASSDALEWLFERRPEDALIKQLGVSWDGRISLVASSADAHGDIGLGIRLGMKSEQAGDQLLQALRSLAPRARSKKGPPPPPPKGTDDAAMPVVLRMLGRDVNAVRQGQDLVITASGVAAPAWPTAPLSQLSLRGVLQPLFGATSSARLTLPAPVRRPQRDPGVPTSDAYIKKLAALDAAQAALAERLGAFHAYLQRQRHLAGDVRVRVRKAKRNLNIAVEHSGGAGAARALHALLADDSAALRSGVYQASDEARMLGMDLARVYEEERARHEASKAAAAVVPAAVVPAAGESGPPEPAASP